jgi:hypothetical protein
MWIKNSDYEYLNQKINGLEKEIDKMELLMRTIIEKHYKRRIK